MPKVLGRYHIISELGRGGMGVVYKAVDPKLERFIAIKCLSEELSNDEITVTRFLREARNVAALNHPHIAQIFLADEDEGKPYFVMEFIDGESLAERLARDTRLMPEQARRILIECAEALKAAHEENIVHRDIKPGNIMIDRRGRTVLTDFGIASIVHPDSQPKASKYIMGTPGYLPPEVMTGRAADHRGDIFALGAVYYEMLAGKRLVPGSGIEDTARTLLAADFPELGDLDEQLGQASFGILGRMLAPDPDKRYQDYDALLADLRPEAPVAVSVAGAGTSNNSTGNPTNDPTRVAPPPSAPSSVPSSAPVASAAAPTANATPPATEAIKVSQGEPPPTLSAPPPAGRHRVRNASLIGIAALAFVVLAVGMVRLAPDQFDQLTARFGGQTDNAVALAEPDSNSPAPLTERQAEGAGETADSARVDSELEFARVDESAWSDDRALAEVAPSAADAGLVEAAPQEVKHAEARRPLSELMFSASAARIVEKEDLSTGAPVDQGQAVEPASAPLRQPEPLAEQPRAVVEVSEQPAQAPLTVAAVPESRAPVPEQSTPTTAPAVASVSPSTTSSAAPDRPSRAAEPPKREATGVIVLGVGDSVFVDPMVREVERALAEQGHEIIERGYVRGLAGLLGESELDLAELTQAALAAGAGKAVVVRAMPAGERQLEYYGRYDTAFIVQTETVSYDFNAGRRLGASELQQVEYTALNATRQARDAIAPRLVLISEQLGEGR